MVAVCQAAATPRGSPHGVYATYHNNVEDLLSGQDGIPIHPIDYQASGKLSMAVDQDGNAMEQVEAHLSYYEGRYFLYACVHNTPPTDLTSLKHWRSSSGSALLLACSRMLTRRD